MVLNPTHQQALAEKFLQNGIFQNFHEILLNHWHLQIFSCLSLETCTSLVLRIIQRTATTLLRLLQKWTLEAYSISVRSIQEAYKELVKGFVQECWQERHES